MKRTRTSPKVLEGRRQAKLKKIHTIGPLLAASFVKIRRKCGKESCRCATGERHPAHIVTFKVKGKTKSVYVPVDLVDEVEKWVENYRELKGLIREVTRLSLALIQCHVPAGRGASRKRGPKSPT